MHHTVTTLTRRCVVFVCNAALDQKWEGVFELFGLGAANHGEGQPKPTSENFPHIGVAERRRLGIQFLAQVFDDLPSLPSYYLQPYVGPLFQVPTPASDRLDSSVVMC
jgi:hypothetical protein